MQSRVPGHKLLETHNVSTIALYLLFAMIAGEKNLSYPNGNRPQASSPSTFVRERGLFMPFKYRFAIMLMDFQHCSRSSTFMAFDMIDAFVLGLHSNKDCKANE